MFLEKGTKFHLDGKCYLNHYLVNLTTSCDFSSEKTNFGFVQVKAHFQWLTKPY